MLWTLWLCLWWSIAWGQTPAADGARLPVLIEQPPAVYPAEALAEGSEAVVVLRLDIGADGRVFGAAIETSGGDAFDAAALNAAADYVFSPAVDADGRVVAATVLFSLKFEAEKAPVRSVEGKVVLSGGGREPAVGLQVRLRGPDGVVRSATTDDDGLFSLAGLEPGAWVVGTDAPGLTADLAEVEIEADRVAQVVLFVTNERPWLDAEVSETIDVFGARQKPEVTERVLNQDEVRYLPGSSGDVVRAILNLPGLAKPPLGTGQLIIRGSAPEESRYYVNGAQVPLVFHFAGLTTVLNGDVIDTVRFLPGNYSARYGRSLGGVVDLETDLRLPERSNGYGQIDLFQATAFAEVKLSEKSALWGSARRSYADAILQPILGDGEQSFRAPRYYDGQARWLHRMDNGSTLELLTYLSNDRFRIVGGDDGEGNPSIIGFATSFERGFMQYRGPLGEGWRHESTLSLGADRQEFEFGVDEQAFERWFRVDARFEAQRPVPVDGHVGLRLGLDLQSGTHEYLYDLAEFGPLEGGDSGVVAPAFYAETTLRFGISETTLGARFDMYSFPGEWFGWSLDPRVTSTLELGSGSDLKLSVGTYSQFPTPRQVISSGDADGVNDLTAARALQTAIGYDQEIGAGMSIEVVGFYNPSFDLVVGREDRFRFFSGPPPSGPFDTEPYGNLGTGYASGVEVFYKFTRDRLLAWFSGTFVRSFRTGRDGVQSRFVFDQPIVLNALASYRLGKRWRLGGRVRTASGNPYTEVVNRFQLLDTREWVPVFGDKLASRLKPFFSLDVRVDKEWVFRRSTLAIFLDIQNATNFRNVEVLGYTDDFSEEDPVEAIPTFPVFGVRLSL